MVKVRKNGYFCKECGYETAKWQGQCPVCKEWNTLVDAPINTTKNSSSNFETLMPSYIDDIKVDDDTRYLTGYQEFDRVLGGGIVVGALVLVGGDPGIGKSTILLQVCMNLAHSDKKVLYISGEESLKQIKLRSNRLGQIKGDLSFLCETNLNSIQDVITKHQPQVVVIDSIQTMVCEDVSFASGSVSQVRQATNVLMNIAKRMGISIFIVGHVTKEGQVAGPRVLEHMVDTVLYFEGERTGSYRILRAVKNRFGSTNEIGVFEMNNAGLSEVLNPSEYMISGRPKGTSGALVTCLMEGTRPILLEVQALVTPTVFGLPRRTVAGTDLNRTNLLLAVIEKRCHIQMSKYDAYVNIAGGLKVNEPALDLAIIMALVSSVKDKAMDDKTVVFGEVGLAGEVRSVSMIDMRVKEAQKLGFETVILPHNSLINLTYKTTMKIIAVKNIREAIDCLV